MLSILKPASSRGRVKKKKAYALVVGLTASVIHANKSFDGLMVACKSIPCIVSGVHHRAKILLILLQVFAEMKKPLGGTAESLLLHQAFLHGT